LNIELCKSCGVPLFIAFISRWESNGVINCDFLPGGRGIFYESDTINAFTNELQELLGISLEHILIESIRRDVRGFMENFLAMQISQALDLPIRRKGEEPPREAGVSPEEILELQKLWNIQAITVGRVFGYGDVLLGESWESGDRHPWRTQIIRNPYSIAAYTAAAIGTVESFEKRDMWANYELIGENTYRITVYPEQHPAGLCERLERKGYDYALKPGDIVYQRCPGCGVPVDMAGFRWSLEEGIIVDEVFNRRMALLPPVSIDAFLTDLESELGSDIPEAVIEMQRRTIKSYMSKENWSRSGWEFKKIIGLRGMGNLTGFKASRDALTVRIENSCVHLLMIGFVQALAELAFGVESSSREWSLAEDGDLSITITV
jgi:hypothetical protein